MSESPWQAGAVREVSQAMKYGPRRPLGYRQLTSLGSAAGFTDVPAGARYAIIMASAQAIRWRDDGTNPTTTVGMPLAAGTALGYNGDLTTIKFIEEAAGGIINAAFYE